MASATAADSSSIDVNVAAAAEAAADSRGKRPVWNVPSNGAIEVGPVMGAASWPALTESTKASPKSPPSDSLKSLSDGPVSSSPAPLVSSPSAKPSPNPKSPNQIQNPMPPSRQKSLKVGERSSSGTLANVGAGPTLQIAPEHSPRASRSGGPTPQPRGGANHHRGFGGNRRGNAGGGSHSNHGNWHHRNGQVHRGGMKSYPRPMQPLSPPFAGPPPPFQPFVGNAMGFPGK